MGNCAEPGVHYVLKTPYKETPPNAHVAYFASGCFWGSEELMWKTPGVLSTAVGYQGGRTDNPTYRDICTGRTNHAEGVRVVYDPAKVAYTDLLRAFWQSHDPTQGNRQGNDAGTQYRSAIFAENPEHLRLAELSKAAYEEALAAKGYGKITTEIAPAEGRPFYFAEEEHQQYLAKPGSRQYCSAQPTGVPLPDASKWLPKELEHHAPKLDDVPASRCAKGKCSL